jgi:hypothetical protein
MNGMLRVPRSRGALSGVLLVLLGAWGALVPLIGPHFHYAYSPDRTWTFNTGRLWLEILPGAITLLSGVIVLLARSRPLAVFGAWVAAMSGAWFVVGGPVSTLWTIDHLPAAGQAVGSTVSRAVEEIGFFGGLGALIIFFAALAMGRFTVVGLREAEEAAEQAPYEETEAGQLSEDTVTVPGSATERFSVRPGTGTSDDRPTVG